MLHTLYSLSRLQDRSDIVLDQNHYNIFDSRDFKSDLSIEDSFKAIETEFIRLWHNTIRPFIDAFMNNHNVYKVNPNKPFTLIPEEGIYLELQKLDRNKITYFYRTKEVRLIGIDSDEEKDKDNSLSIFDSPVYDPLNKSFYHPITVILYKKVLTSYKDNEAALNRVLLRIANMLTISFIDNQLMSKHNVRLNRILASNSIDSNKDVIILPESLNISDTRFIHSYFYTLFKILLSVLNQDYLYNFTDYSNIISLPDIFKFNMTDEEAAKAEEKLASMTDSEAAIYADGFKHKIYTKIWNQARNGNPVSDNDYIEICADILRNLEINLDTAYYEAQQDAQEYEDTFSSEDE